MRAVVTAATELVDEIASRFEHGDPAEELIGRLAVEIAVVERYATQLEGELPPELRAEIARLLARLQTAASGGDDWLAQGIGPELAAQNLRQRVCRAYGLPPRDD